MVSSNKGGVRIGGLGRKVGRRRSLRKDLGLLTIIGKGYRMTPYRSSFGLRVVDVIIIYVFPYES